MKVPLSLLLSGLLLSTLPFLATLPAKASETTQPRATVDDSDTIHDVMPYPRPEGLHNIVYFESYDKLGERHISSGNLSFDALLVQGWRNHEHPDYSLVIIPELPSSYRSKPRDICTSVTFKIGKNRLGESVKRASSSGSPAFDLACLEAVKFALARIEFPDYECGSVIRLRFASTPEQSTPIKER